MSSKILILNGSPRPFGNTAALIREFSAGASQNGNEVVRFDLDRMNIHTCRGCMAGGKNPDSPCVQKDDMDKIYSEFRRADIVVFASPMYFWNFSAQLRRVLDRLFAVMEATPGVKMPPKSVMLLMPSGSDGEANFEPVRAYFSSLCRHLGWTEAGSVYAGGVRKIGAIAGKPALKEAFELGKSIH